MAEEFIDFEKIKKKTNPKTVVIVVGIIAILYALFSSVYMVDQKEEAVVLLMGEFNRITGPGLHFKLPFGIEKNYNVSTQRVFKEEFGFRTEKAGVTTTYSRGDYSHESIMLTGDLNIVDVQWIIQYKIKDARAWLFNVENQRKTIRDISQSVINLLIGDRTIFDIIGSERSNIESKGQDMMNRFYDHYKIGVTVTTVKLQNIVPPKGAVQDAFEDVNKAIQDRNRLINEGKEAYNKAIPRTRGEALQLIQEAEGYAQEKVNMAKGDIARFLAVYGEYRKHPRITRMRLYYEMIEKVFKKAGETDLIDKNLKNFIPFKSMSKEKGGKK
ncbi:MAG: FtsH protease activity modulator HflK [Candidatus Aminicenantes bacterium]|nr:FtsH protease activity modulator HflK [Candidatus Aminicenantes bacterium]